MSDKPTTGDCPHKDETTGASDHKYDEDGFCIFCGNIIYKPTTGEHAEWCIGGVKGPCNCKSASGEWTEIVDRADKELEETVSNFLAGLGYESGKVKEIILRAINAALAAEREKVERLGDIAAELRRDKEKAIEQLAAEREKSRILGSIVEGLRAKLPPEETNPLMKQIADSLEQKWNKVKKAK